VLLVIDPSLILHDATCPACFEVVAKSPFGVMRRPAMANSVLPMSGRRRLVQAVLSAQRQLTAGVDLQDAVFDTARTSCVAPAAIWRELAAASGRDEAGMRKRPPTYGLRYWLRPA
jgi:hypothetical protein